MGLLLAGVTSSLVACVDQMPVEEEETSETAQASGGGHGHGHGPSAAEEAFGSDVADAMIDRLVALLFREFAVTTPDNAEVGSAAISNIFHDDNKLMRLVGDVGPLQNSNRPRDSFERDALAAAKLGNNFERTERVNGRWWVRKSLAVSTEFSTSCVHCHSNFVGLSNPWVGALMVRARAE
ncbi:MAG: hypothetical protein AB7T06_38835 [Kofleriaceae bacterium]